MTASSSSAHLQTFNLLTCTAAEAAEWLRAALLPGLIEALAEFGLTDAGYVERYAQKLRNLGPISEEMDLAPETIDALVFPIIFPEPGSRQIPWSVWDGLNRPWRGLSEHLDTRESFATQDAVKDLLVELANAANQLVYLAARVILDRVFQSAAKQAAGGKIDEIRLQAEQAQAIEAWALPVITRLTAPVATMSLPPQAP